MQKVIAWLKTQCESKVVAWLERQSQWQLAIMGLPLVVALGFFDLLATSLVFTFLYLLLVALFAFVGGMRLGIFIGVATTIAHSTGHWVREGPMGIVVQLWNLSEQLGMFVCMAWVAARLKTLTEGLDELVARRTADLETALCGQEQIAAQLRDHLERFRQVTEGISEVFWLTDPAKQQMIYVSPGYEKIWGRTCESLYQSPRDWIEAIHPEDRERVLRSALTNQIRGDYDEQYRIRRLDGSVRWIRDRSFLVPSAAGEPIRIAGIAADITGQKTAEEQILLLARFPSENPNPVLRLSREGVVTYANAASDALMRLWGCAIGDPIPEPWRSLFVQAKAQNEASLVELDCGGRIYILDIAPIPEAGYVNLYGREITKRKRIEESLQQLNQTYERLTRNAGEAIFRVSAEGGQVLYVNPAAEELFGYSAAEWQADPELGLKAIHPDSALTQKDSLAQMQASGAIQKSVILRWLAKDGRVVMMEHTIVPIADATGKIVMFESIGRDITVRHRAEEALKESEARYRELILNQGEGVGFVDQQECFTFANPAGEAIFGVPAGTLVGRRLNECMRPDQYVRVQAETRKRRAGERSTYELEIIRPDGQTRHLAVTAVPRTDRAGRFVGAFGLFRDVTELKQAEEQLRWVAGLNAALAELHRPLTALDATILGCANAVLVQARHLTDSPHGFVSEIDPVTGDMVGHTLTEMLHGQCAVEGEERRLVFPRGRDGHYGGLWGHALNTREAFYTNAPQTHPACKGAPERHLPLERFLAVPVLLDREVVGLIALSNSGREYAGRDLQAIGRLADFYALAIQRKRVEEQLRQQAGVLENMFDGVLMVDEQGIITLTNAQMDRMFGYARGELIGQSDAILKAPALDIPPRQGDSISNRLDALGHWAGEFHNRRKDGSEFVTEARITSIRANGRRHLITVQRDITARKQAEQQLQESEARFRILFETAPLGIALHGPDGPYRQTNQAYQKMLGYTQEELLSLGIQRVTHPDDIAEGQRLYAELRDGRSNSYQREKRYLHKNGHLVWGLSCASAVRSQKGDLEFITSIVEDITARKRAEAELQLLPHRLIEAQENERQRVALELHDGVNQIIASTRMRLGRVEETLGTTAPAARVIVARCSGLLAEALEENRRIAHALHPRELDDLGLAEACRNLCKEFHSRTGVVVRTHIPREWPRMPRPLELSLFRITQESVTNAERHARAKTLRLRLTVQNETVVLKIQDDGRGFDPEKTRTGIGQRHGLGLKSIKERVVLLGGTWSVVSKPGQGTTVTIRLPHKPTAKP